VGQVFELERVRVRRGRMEVEVAYGITSLGRDRADARRLLAVARGHWGIENRLHWVRDETLGEDRCRVRTGASPEVLAAVRNAAVHLLEGVTAPSKAAATRRFAAHPHKALPLLFT
jgi:Transposase DDE domain